MSKREVTRLLRAALAVMNDGGAHWTRTALRRSGRHGTSFCPLGAINHVTGRPNSARGYVVDNRNRAAVHALANAIRAERGDKPLSGPRADDEAVHTIWSFNDHAFRTWPQVVRVFTAAARAPVFPKTTKGER